MNNTQLISQMYKNGIGINKISSILKIPALEVYRALEQENISIVDYKYEERDSNVCKYYNEGKKITEIAEIVKITRHTVTDILKRNFIYKGNIRASNFSEDKKERNEKVIELYNSGMSLREVANEMNLSQAGICVILKQLGVERRPQHMKGHSKGTTKNRKHFFDFSYFDKIDTEEKAYWLGFLYADGYISYNGVIVLSLQEKDLHHIEKFKHAIKADTTPVKYNSKTNSYRLTLSSTEMANDLIDKGCTQKKSTILKFPTKEQVPENLIHHFMRGYFDGDGCLCVSESSKYHVAFSVLGTHDFLDIYEDILIKHLNNRTKNKRGHKKDWNENTEQICYGGNVQVNEIYNFLYKDATIFLERKKDKFNKVSSRLRSKSQKT